MQPIRKTLNLPGIASPGKGNGPGAAPRPVMVAQRPAGELQGTQTVVSDVSARSKEDQLHKPHPEQASGKIPAQEQRPSPPPATLLSPWEGQAGPAFQRPRPSDSVFDIASYVLSLFKEGTELAIGADSQLKHYENNHWRSFGRNELEAWVLRALRELGLDSETGTSRRIKSVADAMKTLALPLPEPLKVTDDYIGSMNLANGELWFKKDGGTDFKAHTAESGHTYGLPYDYSPAAHCPLFFSALDAIAQSAEDPEAFKRFLLALFGYILQPTRNYAVVLIWLGEGSNGKTLLVKVLASMLPPGSVLHCSISDLNGSRRSLAPLISKRLIIDDDVGMGTVLPDGLLKKISEAKTLTASLGRQGDVEFVNTAVPLFLCNSLPGIQDLSLGMRRKTRAMLAPVKSRKTLASERPIAAAKDQNSSCAVPAPILSMPKLSTRTKASGANTTSQINGVLAIEAYKRLPDVSSG